MRKSLSGLAAALAVGALAATGSSATAGPAFTYDGTVDTFTAGPAGVYEITAAGAQGGSGPYETGGLGAVVDGDVVLTAGEQLKVVVGGMGSSGAFADYAGGGGGGSFVFVAGAAEPLAVAGGGGGASNGGYGGGPGQAGTAGENATGPQPAGVTGGTNGSGGGGGTGSFGGGGGGGYLGNGADALNAGILNAGYGGSGPPTFAGGQGATDGQGHYANGGFGGGGGGGGYGGGGGGGYSGGAGASTPRSDSGGGGSYLDPSFLNSTITGGTLASNTGDGSVTIAYVGPAVNPVPEPATLVPAALAGLMGVGYAASRRRRAA